MSWAARAGEDGLDLARTCPGQADGTLTEKAAHEISWLIRQSDYFIDLHTGGNAYRISPLAGYMLHPSQAILDKQRMMAQAFNLPTVWGTTPHLEGRTLSVARNAHIPAIYTEYGGGGDCQPRIIEKLLTGCLNVMGRLGMLDRRPSEKEVVHTIEDSSENSGHLQIMHPAPADGMFEVFVNLDDLVEAGQPLGVLYSLMGEKLATITASQAGMVFLLRAIPPVKQGDALGGILPINQTGQTIAP